MMPERPVSAKGMAGKIRWWDCTVGFDCVCGKSVDFVLSDESEPAECDDCGRKWRLDTQLLVQEPEPGGG